jgi:hypothetical protein
MTRLFADVDLDDDHALGHRADRLRVLEEDLVAVDPRRPSSVCCVADPFGP